VDDDDVTDSSLGQLKSTSIVCLLIALGSAGVQGVRAARDGRLTWVETTCVVTNCVDSDGDDCSRAVPAREPTWRFAASNQPTDGSTLPCWIPDHAGDGIGTLTRPSQPTVDWWTRLNTGWTAISLVAGFTALVGGALALNEHQKLKHEQEQEFRSREG
jgi:hypothetical protein